MSGTGRVRLMQGNEACVEGALAAGLRFFAGYPITPSTEIAELLAERLPAVGGKFIQMEDEIASMGAVIGASLAGLKSMTATSGPGFSLKQENIGYAALTEVPCVIVDVQRVGPSTGMPTSPAQGDVMQARWGTHGDHPIVVYTPWSVGETYSLTVRCFNTAEELRTPVILLMDEVVGHMRERVMPPAPGELEVVNRRKPAQPPHSGYRPYDPGDGDIPPLAAFGDGYRFHVTGLSHDMSGFPTNDSAKAEYLHRRVCDKVEKRR
ncbi:MAG: 2-oxoacid:acceptor oxidoreductase subunit alpha, partial [Bacillota bacterium]